MNDTPVHQEEVIQNLLHVDIHIRRKGFQQLKSTWVIEYREYLYKAIETEKERSFQTEMVQFILDRLGVKSLRKMIRFAEKNQLFPASRDAVIPVYLRHEPEASEVRQALVKSLKRPGSRTAQFVGSMLSSHHILQLWEQPQLYQHLMADTTGDDIPDSERFTILSAFLQRYIRNPGFRGVTGNFIWELVRQDTVLHTYVLEHFFNRNIHPDIKTKAPLSWHHWSWQVRGTSLRHREFIRPLNEFDEFLISSVSSSAVLPSLVPILANLVVSPPPHHNEAYVENIYTTWDELLASSSIPRVLEFDVVTYEDVPDLAAMLHVDLGGINLHDLLLQVYGYLPRYYLAMIATSVSDNALRATALRALNRKEFLWDSDSDHLLGPPRFWTDLLGSCFSSLGSASEAEVNSVTAFIFSLVDYYERAQPNVVTFKVREVLTDFTRDQSILSASVLSWPIYLKLHQLLEGEMPELPPKLKLTESQRQLIVDDFFAQSCPASYIMIMDHVAETGSYELTSYLLDHLSTHLESEMREGDALEPLVASLCQHHDVRIRTRATLLKTKFDAA